MFVYERNGKICVTFQNNMPVESPEYEFLIDKEAGLIYVNGIPMVAVNATQLDADLVNETAIEIAAPVAINLNGHTISIPDDTEGSGVYHVTAGGSLTINGAGVINGVGKNDYNMAIWADGGNVTINGGTVTNKGATAVNDPTHFDLIYAKNGSIVEINGGYFECETPKWTLNCNDSNPGTIIVKGGTFVDFDPSCAETEPGGPVSFVAPGYKVVKKDNLYTVVRA